jgi:hypothetical protein
VHSGVKYPFSLTASITLALDAGIAPCQRKTPDNFGASAAVSFAAQVMPSCADTSLASARAVAFLVAVMGPPRSLQSSDCKERNADASTFANGFQKSSTDYLQLCERFPVSIPSLRSDE